MSKVTLKQVKSLVVKWQPILGLSDYSITVVVAEIKGDILGHCAASEEASRAQITINPNHDQIMADTIGSLGVSTVEETVVHELLHIQFVQLKEAAMTLISDKREAEFIRVVEERTVDRLALSLVRKFNARV